MISSKMPKPTNHTGPFTLALMLHIFVLYITSTYIESPKEGMILLSTVKYTLNNLGGEKPLVLM